MTLKDLETAANTARTRAVNKCRAINMLQTTADLAMDLPSLANSSVVIWARSCEADGTKNSQVLSIANSISTMADAIDLYLYAKQHGLEAATLWKLSR